MKYNLKNRPQIFRLEGRYVTDLKKMKEWFEGFEAELRSYCDRCEGKNHKLGYCPDCGIDSFIKELLGEEEASE